MVSRYSNSGAGLAGYIVERVSGLPFEQYIEDRILHPLTLLYGVTPALKVALTLPLVAIGFTSGAIFLAVKDWKAMHRLRHIHYGAVTVAMVAFAGWLFYWNLLGWRL